MFHRAGSLAFVSEMESSRQGGDVAAFSIAGMPEYL
jgi:hypothetical protein